MASVLGLTIGLCAWVTYIYVQYYYGDRPTNEYWFAAMMALGTFEYLKGIFMMAELGVPATMLAAGAAGLTAIVVLAYQLNVSNGDAQGVIELLVGEPGNEVGASQSA